MKESLGEEESTRASFLEKVLSSEILEEGEGIVGEVAKTGKPVFVANAQSDRESSGTRIPRWLFDPWSTLLSFTMIRSWVFW